MPLVGQAIGWFLDKLQLCLTLSIVTKTRDCFVCIYTIYVCMHQELIGQRLNQKHSNAFDNVDSGSQIFVSQFFWYLLKESRQSCNSSSTPARHHQQFADGGCPLQRRCCLLCHLELWNNCPCEFSRILCSTFLLLPERRGKTIRHI